LAIQPLPELLKSRQSSEDGLSASDAAKSKRLLVDFIGRFRNPLVLAGRASLGMRYCG